MTALIHDLARRVANASPQSLGSASRLSALGTAVNAAMTGLECIPGVTMLSSRRPGWDRPLRNPQNQIQKEALAQGTGL